MIEVFGEKNYHWATTKEIAEKAGVTERVIFFYYKTKKELYRAVMEYISSDFEKALLRGKPPVDDIKTFIKMGARNYVDYFENNRLKIKIMVQGIDNVADTDLKEDFRNLANKYYTLVRESLRKAHKAVGLPEELLETTTAITAGAHFMIAYAEILDLDWFRGEHEDIVTIGGRYAELMSSILVD